MKRILSIVVLSCVITISWSQSDSIAFVTANWQVERIGKGVTWKRFLFKGNLFGSNQSINIVEIKRNKKLEFAIGYDSLELKLTSDFGKTSQALAAINGTFFDIKNGGSVDFLKVNGQVINQNRIQNDQRAVHQKAAIILEGAALKLEKWNGQPDWENTLKAENIMLSGPLLILDNKMELIDSSSFSYTRHPRAAIVVTNSNRVLLVTVDGRDPNAAGMSLFELARIMRWLNAVDGINLDGGGSTTLWIHNQPDNGVVNYPSDNKIWDHLGERKVANVILIRRK